MSDDAVSQRIRRGEYNSKLEISRREDGEEEWLRTAYLVKEDQDRLKAQMKEDIFREAGLVPGSQYAEAVYSFLQEETEIHYCGFVAAIRKLESIFFLRGE